MSPTDRAPFPLADVLPESLRGVLLDFHWSLERLHTVGGPLRSVALADLSWHLELPFWADGGRPFQVSPAQVRTDPQRYAEQWRRTMAADLSFPLHGYVAGDGRLTVLDGVHRLLKAHVEGQETLRIHVLQDEDLDTIAVPRR